MKTISAKILIGILVMLSFSAFAAKVTVTGTPVILEQRGDVYYLPTTYTAPEGSPYYYVTIGGQNRVCFLEPQPDLASLDVMAVNVNVGGNAVIWNCYAYDEEHFVVTP